MPMPVPEPPIEAQLSAIPTIPSIPRHPTPEPLIRPVNENNPPLRMRREKLIAPMMDLPVCAPTTRELSLAPYPFSNSPVSHNGRRRRSPSVDSLPALSAPSPASSHAWYPSSPLASTPPDSPVRTAFGIRQESSFKSSSSNLLNPMFIRRAEDDHGLHLLLLALESEPHMPFIPNAPVTMSARQHDTSPPSPHHLISPAGRTPCHAPLARPNDRTSVIDDDGVRIDTDSQGERASENEPPAPRIPSQVSQEGVVENHHDPDMGIINVALDSSEGPMTSEEEMVSPLITLPLSRFHEPCEDSSDVLDFVHAELITPESSSTVIAAPPIFPCLPSVSDERRESVNVILGPAEAASVDISNTANVTDRLIKSAVPSRRCSRASSPLPELIEFVPQTPIRPPDPQPEASADIAPDNMQALLPLSASPVLPQSDLPAQEDQITIDVCIPNTPQSAIPPPPEIKKERKKHSIALPNDSRLRKRHRRTSEVENIDSFSVPESSTRASSDMTDASTGKRRATKRPGNSVSVSNETDEPSTSKPASAPLKVVQQRGRPTPYASDTPNAESPGMSDPNGSGGDLREDTDIPALIVDALVFGRLSFLSAPDLAKNILRDHPYLLERSGDQAAWVAIVRSVLETHSFFGRIPRCGLGPDGKKLEDTWYYEAARDPDRARAETLADFAPSRRRKAKMGDRTYFYAPVDMNRWVISAELGDDA